MNTHAPLARAAAFTWRILLVAAGVLAFLYVFQRLTLLFLPLIIALFITTILTGPVKSLASRGIPRLASVWIVLLVSLGSIGLLGYLLAPQIAEEFGALGPTLEEARGDIEDWLVNGPVGLSESQLDQYTEQGIDAISESTSSIAQGAVTGATLAAEVVAGILLIFVLTFFFLKDGDKMAAWFVGLVREEHRDLARALGRRAWTAGGGFVRGTAFIAFVDALGIALGLVLIGVPLVLPLAILTFFGGFFPLVGATAAGAVAVLVALVSGGPGDALLTLGVVIAVQQTEGNILEPIVLSRAVSLHPVAVLAVLTAGGVTYGLLGAFLAVPTAAVITAIGSELRERNLIGPGRPLQLAEAQALELAQPVEPAHDPGPPEDFRTDGREPPTEETVDRESVDDAAERANREAPSAKG